MANIELNKQQFLLYTGGGAGLICGIIFLVGIILICVLVPLSFAWLSYDQFGLDYSIYTHTGKSIPHQVSDVGTYPPGRHFLGLGHYFITVPRTYQTIQGTVASRTRDGLEIELSISFQYRITQDQLLTVFEKFATKYEVVIKAMAQASVRDVVSLYNAIQFFEGLIFVSNAEFLCRETNDWRTLGS
jgi:regulator of protease activity HflC (stomatin/prohibitin superfamily)